MKNNFWGNIEEVIFESALEIERMSEQALFDSIIEDVKEWHEKTFPDAKFQEQLIKLEEEMKEMAEAVTTWEKEKEFADVMIVCAGLKRWDCHIADYFIRQARSYCGGCALSLINKKIIEKMEKNRNRVWERMPDGTFHHKEKGENNGKDN